MERLSGDRRRIVAPALLAVIALTLLAACSGSSSAAKPAATQTPTVSSNSTANAGSPTPGVTPIGPGGGTQGSSDVCSQPVTKTIDLPASVPSYPNGELRVAESNGGIDLFGVCSPDSVTTIGQFYTTQLPAKGWGSVSPNLIDGVELITATLGNASVSVAIRPESSGGNTDIVIQTNGL